jgi:hypothetical protein
MRSTNAMFLASPRVGYGSLSRVCATKPQDSYSHNSVNAFVVTTCGGQTQGVHRKGPSRAYTRPKAYLNHPFGCRLGPLGMEEGHGWEEGDGDTSAERQSRRLDVLLPF